MKIGWLMGWATPRHWFEPLVRAVFAEDDHVYVEAEPNAWERLEQHGRFDCLVGYSLGSHLLLINPERAARVAPRVVLLAPIFAFPQEAGLGGKAAGAQIRYLVKWLKRDLPAALADFSVRAELALPTDLAKTVDVDSLEWGLKCLETGRADPPAPSGWTLYCGSGDKLLDVEQLRKLDPAVHLVNGASHHPARLLEAWAETREKTVGAVNQTQCVVDRAPAAGRRPSQKESA